MKKPPKVRADGKCRCGQARPEPAIKDGDPFCSAECARAYYGTSLPEITETGRRRPTKETTAKQSAARKATRDRKGGTDYTIRKTGRAPATVSGDV